MKTARQVKKPSEYRTGKQQLIDSLRLYKRALESARAAGEVLYEARRMGEEPGVEVEHEHEEDYWLGYFDALDVLDNAVAGRVHEIIRRTLVIAKRYGEDISEVVGR